MAKQRALFVEHLENISWKVLQAYPGVTKDLLRRRFGIYALYRREKLYYVGLASSLKGRVNHHLKDQHKGAWDRFSVYLTSTADHMRELEALVVRIVRPPGNKQTGRLAGARDLRRVLKARIRDHDEDRRAMLLGGDAMRARRRRKTRRGTGSILLAGLVERPTPLSATYKGETFKARLRRDGKILFRGRHFENPSAAARAAAGRPMHGWVFWKVRKPNGTRVNLRTLKH